MDNVEALLRDMRTSDPTKRGEIRDRLIAMGTQIAPVLLRYVYQGIGTEEEEVWGSPAHHILRELSSLFPHILTDALQNADFEVRAGAAYEMSRLDEASSIDALVQTMRTDPHPEVQYQAMGTLHDQYEELSGLVDIEAFEQFLGHDEDRFRSLATTILGNLGDKNAVPSLISMLDDGADDIRMHAIEALGKLMSADAVPNILQHLQSSTVPHVRAAAIVTLGVLKAESAVPDLIRCLNDESMSRHYVYYSYERMCDLACVALEKIGTHEALEATNKWKKGEPI
jgi:HEAT repeat protein